MTTTQELLTDAELEALSEEVSYQLEGLRLAGIDWSPASSSEAKTAQANELPDVTEQRTELQRITGVPFQTFWQHFLRYMRQEFCSPNGSLHEQWLKARSLGIKDTVRVAHGTLRTMGCPAQSLGPVTVAATVILLNVAFNAGIDALWAECAVDEKKG